MQDHNWKEKKFGDAYKVQSGFAFKTDAFVSDPVKGVAIIRMNNLKSGRVSRDNVVYIDKNKVRNLEKFEIKTNDFLFGMSGSLDNFAVVRAEDTPCYLNQRVGRLLPVGCVHSFAKHLYKSTAVRKGIHKFAAGNAQLNISPRQIESIKVLLTPSYEEQEAIACILDALDKVIELTQEAISGARILEHSFLHDLLENGLFSKMQPGAKQTRRWVTNKVDEVAEVGSGVTLGKDVSGFKTVELPYLRVANVQDGHLDLSSIKTIRVPVDEVERCRLEAGDMLMTEGGDIDKLGRGTIWDGQIQDCLHQNHIFRVRSNRQLLDPNYFAFVVESDIAKRYFFRVAKRTTNLASINKTQLRAFRFPVPPLEEQKKISDMIKAAKAITSGLMEKETSLRELKKALMHDLLTGKVRVNHGIDKILSMEAS